jgi:hypothetical protein
MTNGTLYMLGCQTFNLQFKILLMNDNNRGTGGIIERNRVSSRSINYC